MRKLTFAALMLTLSMILVPRARTQEKVYLRATIQEFQGKHAYAIQDWLDGVDPDGNLSTLYGRPCGEIRFSGPKTVRYNGRIVLFVQVERHGCLFSGQHGTVPGYQASSWYKAKDFRDKTKTADALAVQIVTSAKEKEEITKLLAKIGVKGPIDFWSAAKN